MKAAVCTAYGPPEVVQVRAVPRPVPGAGELLVRVMASSLNSGDARIRGLRAPGPLKLLMRLLFGITKPRNPVLGLMFSGVVVEAGQGATRFKPGDEVFGSSGSKMGAHAEFVVVKDAAVISKKPKNATFEEAAALVFGGETALYFLEKAGLKSIDKPRVLIYGATGSVGVAAVEIAKHYQAHVTAVCSERGMALAKSLGSDEIVLYTRQDFRELDDAFDIVFDAVGKTKRKECARILKKGGDYRTVGSLDVAKGSVETLDFLKALFEAGKLRANIDKVFGLEEVVEAHRYVDSERKKGNVIVRIGV